MVHNMAIEGSIHYLDLLQDLAGATCESIYAQSWTLEWGGFAGYSQTLMTLKFENSVRASVEMSYCSATSLHSWQKELIRAEFENATLVLDTDKVMCYTENQKLNIHVEEVTLKESPKWGNDYILEAFIEWVNGGAEIVTKVEDNYRSMILPFAAIESSTTEMQ